MSKVRLLYRETSGSDGVPQLEDPTGQLSRAELAPWESELARRYQQLPQCDGQVIHFTTAIPGLSNRYRLRVKPVKNRRCPVLELLELDGVPEAPPLPDLPEWLPNFVEATERLLRTSAADRAQRAAVAFLLGELRELDQISRHELTALLLAGYLTLAESQCAGLDNAVERVALYRLAARVVDGWCVGQPGEASVGHQQGAVGHGSGASRWMPGVLARLFGLGGRRGERG